MRHGQHSSSPHSSFQNFVSNFTNIYHLITYMYSSSVHVFISEYYWSRPSWPKRSLNFCYEKLINLIRSVNKLAREPTVHQFQRQLFKPSADWQISWPVTTTLVSTQLVSKPSNQPVSKAGHYLWAVLKPAVLFQSQPVGFEMGWVANWAVTSRSTIVHVLVT